MLTIAPPPRSRIAGTAARHVRNIEATLTSITRRHSSSGISVNGTHRERRVEPGVVDEHVEPAAALDGLVDQPRTSASSATSTVRPTPSGYARGRLLGAPQVGDHDPGALGREPVRDRPADPLRGARDDRDLAVELPHRPRRAARTTWDEDPVLLRVDQRLDLARGTPSSRRGPGARRGAPRAPRSSRSATATCRSRARRCPS